MSIEFCHCGHQKQDHSTDGICSVEDCECVGFCKHDYGPESIHGCFTGDCPHPSINECIATLRPYCGELEQENNQLRMLIDFSKLPPFHKDCRAVRVDETGELSFFGCWCEQYHDEIMKG